MKANDGHHSVAAAALLLVGCATSATKPPADAPVQSDGAVVVSEVLGQTVVTPLPAGTTTWTVLEEVRVDPIPLNRLPRTLPMGVAESLKPFLPVDQAPPELLRKPVFTISPERAQQRIAEVLRRRLQLPVNVPSPEVVEATQEYSGAERGLLWWRKRWQQRSRYMITIVPQRSGVILHVQTRTDQRPNASYPWRECDCHTGLAEMMKVFDLLESHLEEVAGVD